VAFNVISPCLLQFSCLCLIRSIQTDIPKFIVPVAIDGDEDVPGQQDDQPDVVHGPVHELVTIFWSMAWLREFFKYNILSFLLGIILFGRLNK